MKNIILLFYLKSIFLICKFEKKNLGGTYESQTILNFLGRHFVCPKVMFFCSICCTLLISTVTILKYV